MRKSLAGFAFCTQEGDIELRRYTKRYTNFVAALLMFREWKAARGEPAVQLAEGHVRMVDDGGFQPNRHRMHHRKPEQRLDAHRVKVLLQRAADVLGSNDAAREWLQTPMVAFGCRTPMQMAETDAGLFAVEQALGRFEHSVFN